MKKFNMGELKHVLTPMSMVMVLDPDENGEAVDQRKYRSMIGSLFYLMATRLDIQFGVCLCARIQIHTSHRQAVQWIFRYLKYTLKFRISYCASSLLDLVGFSDADFVDCGIDRKTLLVHVIFLNPLLFVGLLANNLLLHNPPQRLSM
jgi:hypothetical protein